MHTTARLIIIIIIACSLIFTTAGHRVPRVTWYVDDDAPGDPGPGDPLVSDPLEDGSSAHPFDAIQEGINAAIDRDAVLVRDGTYTGTGNKNLDFGGRAIAVRAETGPAQTVIDCEGTGCGFYFHSDETTASRVEGFTVTRGSGYYESPYDRGGGVYCFESSPAIAGCIFSNHVTDYGGGVYCRESNAEITGCTFTENQTLLGGGVCLYLTGLDDPASARVEHCTFLNNEAQWHGGAVHAGTSYSLHMMNCVLIGNISGLTGGAVTSDGTDLTVQHALIADNTSRDGGGIYGGHMSLSDCTFTGNTAYHPNSTGKGGGLLSDEDASLTNCILWGNGADLGGQIAVTGGTLGVDYSDVQGGSGGVFLYGGQLSWGTGNMDSDPLFTTGPGGDYYLSQIAAGQGQDSPCADAGYRTYESYEGCTRSDAVQDSGVWDMGYHYHLIFADAGGPYPALVGIEVLFDASRSLSTDHEMTGYRWDWTDDGSWDTGWLGSPTTAHTYNETFIGHAGLEVKDKNDYTASDLAEVYVWEAVIYVDDDNTAGPWDGTAEHPFRFIQDGMDASVEGFTVMIADGTYTGAGNRNLNFNGKAITVRSASGPDHCIIDCEGVDRGVFFDNEGGRESVLRGITIRNGYNPYYGAGINIQGRPGVVVEPTIIQCVITDCNQSAIRCSFAGKPLIKDCVIKDNNSHGIRISSSDVVVSGCTITGNTSGDNGGGIIISGSSAYDVVVENCRISNNTAITGTGGGISGGRSDGAFNTEVNNCIITGNSAQIAGGASVGGNYNNCIITGNTAVSGGGVLLYREGTLNGCTIAGNTATQDGGGVRCGGELYCQTDALIRNTILHDNEAPEGDEIWMDGYREYDPYEMEWYEYPCALTIEYSDVEGGLPLVYVGPTLATLNWGVGMMDADPIFVKGPLGDYYLSQIAAGQAADSPCVEAGYGVMFWPCLDNPPNFRVCGTTRTDREPDTGKVDLGYHYPFTGLKIPPGASLQGVPVAEEGIMQNEEKGGRK